MLEREEGREGVRVEAGLRDGRRGVVDGGRAEEARGADPDVEAAEGGEDLVDEDEGFVFGGGREGVGDELCGGDGGGEGRVGVGGDGFVAGWGDEYGDGGGGEGDEYRRWRPRRELVGWSVWWW